MRPGRSTFYWKNCYFLHGVKSAAFQCSSSLSWKDIGVLLLQSLLTEFEWHLVLTGVKGGKRHFISKNDVTSCVIDATWKVTSFGMKTIPSKATLPWQLDFSCSRPVLRQKIGHYWLTNCYQLAEIKVSLDFIQILTYCTACFWPVFIHLLEVLVVKVHIDLFWNTLMLTDR